MSIKGKDVIYALYEDEEDLLSAVREVKEDRYEIMDVFSPFPVHGLDELLDLSESRLHIAGFVFGMIGTLTAFGFMTWVFVRDWPVIIGGKPYWAIPAFIPITFEITVLFSAIGMTVAFFIICGLGPGVSNPTLDDRITDDKFCLAFDAKTIGYQSDELKDRLNATGAAEVHQRVIES